MKFIITLGMLFLLMAPFYSSQAQDTEKKLSKKELKALQKDKEAREEASMLIRNKPLKTFQDSIAYIFGANIGQNIKAQDSTIDAEILYQGLYDALNKAEVKIDAEAGQPLLMKYQAEMQAKQREAAEREGKENMERGKAFLAENAKKEGIITLESGLQYEVLKEGTGTQPTISSNVTVHYTGTLIDGTKFDSSYDRGEPATFNLNGLIKAWQIAIPLMKEGGKVRIYSPSELAYGPQGPQSIGPNQTLIFDVELISVND